MAVVKVVDVISKAQTLLQDATGVRWPVLELQGWLNDSYRDTVNLRPDCNTQTGTFTCAAGPRQSITTQFAQALRLIEVVRNLAATSDKRAVRLVARSSLDGQRRDWYNATQSATVEYYMYDPRLPKEFLVYPPATALAQLEVVYSSVPAAHALTEAQLINPATTEVIRIDDSFANALLDYIMYRAFSKDAEVQGNAQRAVAHFQAFQNALGVKGQTEAASQPGVA
jgi:hypothetical protein